jgi:hypothetical protein
MGQQALPPRQRAFSDEKKPGTSRRLSLSKIWNPNEGLTGLQK